MARVSQDYYEKKRKEILDAAYSVCVRKPITSVTMKDIIAETGYSHGAIYKYYRDLDEVISDLMLRINREYSFDDDLQKIIRKNGTAEWETAIREICAMLAEHMVNMGTDLVKISLYCEVFAVSEPERTRQIAEKIGEESISPLLDSINTVRTYLDEVIKINRLQPARTADEIINFIMTYYSGVENSYVLGDPDTQKNGLPGELFSVLADALIPMLGAGRDSGRQSASKDKKLPAAKRKEKK